MARQYGVRNPDGSVSIWETDDNGNAWPTGRTESWEQNQGITPGGGYGGYGAPGGYGTTMAGGYGQLGPYNDALQQEYLRQRLAQLEIPGLDLQRLLGQLGITGYYNMGGGMSDADALDYIYKTKDLGGFYQSNGWDVSTPERQRAAARNWLETVDPAFRGLTPQAAAAKLGASTGTGMTAATAGAPGAIPTWERERWNTANEQWGKQFGEGQRQFNQTFGEGQRQFNVSTLASKSGPRDWATYQAMAPSAAFGTVVANPSWEQAFAQYFNQGRQGGSVPPPRQPHQISQSELAGWTPTRRAMEESKWSYHGMDPQDMWERQRRAAPTMQAAGQTVWG